MRLRLRPAYSPEELAALYAVPHDHSCWPDHRLRVKLTAEVAEAMYETGDVADLSCGDAAIVRGLAAPGCRTFLGDIAAGYELQGPLEATVDQIPPVDLFVCCETLEHLDDPDTVLRRLRAKTRALVISTPDGETEPHNPQHYWGCEPHLDDGGETAAA